MLPYISIRTLVNSINSTKSNQNIRLFSVITLKENGKLVKKKSDNHVEKQKFFETLKPVIGLEIHAQLNTKSKLFSFAGYNYKSIPNVHVSNFDCSFPGFYQSSIFDKIKLI